MSIMNSLALKILLLCTASHEVVTDGPTGDGILLEDGTSFLLAENNDFLILE